MTITITDCLLVAGFVAVFAWLCISAAKTAENPACGVAPPFGAADPKHLANTGNPPPVAGEAASRRERDKVSSTYVAPAPPPTDEAD